MTFQSFLQQPFSETEREEIVRLEAEIHRLQAQWHRLENADVVKGLNQMAGLRLKASSTLLRGDHAGWLLANEYIQNKIANDQAPEWQDVCHLNSCLTGQQGEVIRQQEIYTGSLKACPYAELDEVLACFQKEILGLPKTMSVLVQAALCQYWLVSIHPFNDGNGRTAILLTDWLLTMNGYLPQSFSSKVDAVVMYIPDRVKKMTPGLSVARILQNIIRSYQCFYAGSIL